MKRTLEAGAVGDVVDEDGARGPPVVAPRHRSEALLAVTKRGEEEAGERESR
jgi:hypothetical protein